MRYLKEYSLFEGLEFMDDTLKSCIDFILSKSVTEPKILREYGYDVWRALHLETLYRICGEIQKEISMSDYEAAATSFNTKRTPRQWNYDRLYSIFHNSASVNMEEMLDMKTIKDRYAQGAIVSDIIYYLLRLKPSDTWGPKWIKIK